MECIGSVGIALDWGGGRRVASSSLFTSGVTVLCP